MKTKPPRKAVLFHNPRCSKSREAKALLEERGIEFEVVEYLKTPPTVAEVKALLVKLGGKPAGLLRTKEAEYAELGLSDRSTANEVAEAIAKHPVLLERPLLVVGERAAIGRPTEALLPLID